MGHAGFRRGGEQGALAIVATAASGYGGAPKVMAALANHWQSTGRAVVVVSLGSEQPGHYALHPSIKQHQLGVSGASRGLPQALRRNCTAILRLRRVFRTEGVTLAFGFGPRPAVLATLATVGLRCAIVAAVRSDPSRSAMGRVWKWLRLAAYGRAAAVVVQTRAALGFFPTRVRRRCVIIPNAVTRPTLAAAGAAADGRKRIVGVGRLSPEKGFDLLIEAFSRICPAFPDWDLVIWGDGSERERLQALARRLGVVGRVAMPGIAATADIALVRADLFVCPSRFEGFPNALLEAMAAGLPVVSFDCPSGPAEIIRSGLDGRLVPAENVEALASAMQELMADASLRGKLGTRAREVSDRFAVDAVMAQWDALLHKVESEGRAASRD